MNDHPTPPRAVQRKAHELEKTYCSSTWAEDQFTYDEIGHGDEVRHVWRRIGKPTPGVTLTAAQRRNESLRKYPPGMVTCPTCGRSQPLATHRPEVELQSIEVDGRQRLLADSPCEDCRIAERLRRLQSHPDHAELRELIAVTSAPRGARLSVPCDYAPAEVFEPKERRDGSFSGFTLKGYHKTDGRTRRLCGWCGKPYGHGPRCRHCGTSRPDEPKQGAGDVVRRAGRRGKIKTEPVVLPESADAMAQLIHEHCKRTGTTWADPRDTTGKSAVA